MKKILSIVLALFCFCGCIKQSENKIITLACSTSVRDLFVAQVISYMLEENGYKVDKKFNMNYQDLQSSLENGTIDLYAGYLDDVYKDVLKKDSLFLGIQKYDIVKNEMKKHNTTIIGKTLASCSLGFAIDNNVAEYYKIKKISDLKKNAQYLKFAYDNSFKNSKFGEVRFNKIYGNVKWKSSVVQKYTQKELNILSNFADVITCDATDPMMEKGGIKILKDDKKAFRDYNNIIFMANSHYESKHKDLTQALNRLGKILSTRLLREYLAKIDTDETEVKNVASRFYINEIH